MVTDLYVVHHERFHRSSKKSFLFTSPSFCVSSQLSHCNGTWSCCQAWWSSYLWDMVSNFTNVIARLINGGKRTVNSLDICVSWYWPWICFLYISLGTLMLARFSLQMFAHHFVNGNPLASTGPLHFVYFFFLALEYILFVLMSSGLIQWPKRRQNLHSFRFLFSCFGIQFVYFDEFRIDPMTQEKAKLAFLWCMRYYW